LRFQQKINQNRLKRPNQNLSQKGIYISEHFRAVSKYLEEARKNYYTYQLKRSKGLQVVLKGIEPDVTPKDVIDTLKENGFSAKNVSSTINRKKEPQLLFRVELEPDSRVMKTKGSEPHL